MSIKKLFKSYNFKSISLDIIGAVIISFAGVLYLKYPFFNYLPGYLSFWVWLVGLFFLLSLLKLFIFDFKNRIRGIEGEFDVRGELSSLSKMYKSLNNLVIEKKYGNIDHVVVGPTGVWAVETKSHEGVISFDGQELLRDGSRFSEKDFLSQAKSNGFIVSRLIEQKLNKKIYVQSIVVFSSKNAEVRFGENKLNSVFVVGLSWLNRVISKNFVTKLTTEEIIEVYSLLKEYEE